MAKDARIPMRVPEALKAEFEWAAAQDGARGVSTWLRQLGEERAAELRMIERPITKRAGYEHFRTPAAEPALAFVPGFGLNEED